MSSQYIDLPSVGSGSWKGPVANSAALPSSGNVIGDARVTKDTDFIYVWSGSSWILAGGGGLPSGASEGSVLGYDSGAPVWEPTLKDSSGVTSFDWTNRWLYTTFGNSNFIALDYSGNNNSSANISFGVDQYTYFSGTLNMSNVQNVLNNAYAIGTDSNGNLVANSPPATGIESINGDFSQYQTITGDGQYINTGTGGGETVISMTNSPIFNSVGINNGYFITNQSGISAIDPNLLRLISNNGSTPAIDWSGVVNSSWLSFDSGSRSIQLQGNIRNASNQEVIDPQNEVLTKATVGNTLDWGNQHLIRSATGSTVLDWSGTDIALPTATTSVGSSAGTLTNAPAVGNPTGYLTLKINGTNRKIPFW